MLRTQGTAKNIYSLSVIEDQPVKIQHKQVLTQKADINDTCRRRNRELKKRQMKNADSLERYAKLDRQIGSTEPLPAAFSSSLNTNPIQASGNGAMMKPMSRHLSNRSPETAKTFFLQCGNEVVANENEDEFTTDVLYNH
jgi:hypothetical protein